MTRVFEQRMVRAPLFQFRDMIDQFQADKGHYPESLEALVDEGYLRKIPTDPVTGVADWQVVYEEPDPDNPVDMLGISDVRSNAPGAGMDGSLYSEW